MIETALPMPECMAVKLACFEIQGHDYAINVEYVREIVRIMEITPLPNAPGMIEGVIDLRGALIPVVDLGRVLNRGTGSKGLNARIVILEIDGLMLGLWVDRATNVLTLDANQLEDVPDLAIHAGYDVVRHVVRRVADPLIMVLSVDQLIERIYRSALGSVPESRAGEVE